MDRVTWIEHKGREILYIDYSGLDARSNKEDILGVIEEFKKKALEKKAKTLFLSNVTDAYTDSFIFSELKAAAKFCVDNNLIEKECIVGIKGIKKAFVKIINTFARTTLVTFNSVDKAKDWLVE
ncbi:MAG: hypothetical protein ACXAC7_24570 [Candidatus Hodarchaeales archaeon]|jgi:hemerythrin superfamily protein